MKNPCHFLMENHLDLQNYYRQIQECIGESNLENDKDYDEEYLSLKEKTGNHYEQIDTAHRHRFQQMQYKFIYRTNLNIV